MADQSDTMRTPILLQNTADQSLHMAARKNVQRMFTEIKLVNHASRACKSKPRITLPAMMYFCTFFSSVPFIVFFSRSPINH